MSATQQDSRRDRSQQHAQIGLGILGGVCLAVAVVGVCVIYLLTDHLSGLGAASVALAAFFAGQLLEVSR